MRSIAVFALSCACTSEFDPSLLDGGGPCDPTGSFDTPQFVPGIYTDAYDGGAALSHDELELYIDDYVAGGQLFVSRRNHVNEAWGSRELLTELDDPAANDLGPMLGLDDMTLVFASDRTGTFRLYRSSRPARGAPFTAPVLAGVDVAAEAGYLSANNARVWMVVREGNGRLDLYVAEANGSGFDPALNVAELNTPVTDTGPVPNADDTVLYFGSNRADPSRPQLDVWMARRSDPSAAFEPPTLVTELNTEEYDDWPSWLSPDGCRLYMASNRSGNYEVYAARRR